VDRLIIVVEPGRASIETARRIVSLAHDLGISNIALVGNKIHDRSEQDFIAAALPDFPILVFCPTTPPCPRQRWPGHQGWTPAPL
jgi:CO dehydrogenase maturation factor